MRTVARVTALLRGWFRPGALDAEVSEELRFHLARQTEAYISAGMSVDEAKRMAHRTVGNIEAFRAESRAGRPGSVMHQTARDVVLGMRLLRRAPGFAATAALIVALGIGTTTAIVSVVYAVMLRALPYPEQERLVALWTRLQDGSVRARVSAADVRDVRDRNPVFEDIALANGPQNFTLVGGGEPERIVAARLSSTVFSVLRVSPAIGRAFRPSDERSGNDRVVLLSDGLWKRRFGADPSIVGTTVALSGLSYQVIGVMPPGFGFPDREYQSWIPLTVNPRVLARAIAAQDHLAVARLRPGVSMEQARRDIGLRSSQLEVAHPGTNRGIRIDVHPLIEESIRGVRPALSAILVAVGCLLLIASLNLASLLGTRAATREREFAVRLALGASRARLVLQAVAEVAPVLVVGGVAGIVVARLAIDAFVPFAPAALPRADTIAVNGPVLGFSIGILLVIGLVGGVLPARQAWRANLMTAGLATRSGTPGLRQVRTRTALVIAQIALTLPLLAGAAALSRSFSALMSVNPGFNPDNVLSLHMAIPRSKYRSDGDIAGFYRRVMDRVSTLPGVIATGMVNRLPLTANNLLMDAQFERQTGTRSVQCRSVTPDYFRTMDIPVRAGRVFSERDGATAPLVGVIDERLARTLWPGDRAVGKRFRITLPGQAPASGEIIGVVGTIRHGGLDSEGDRQLYVSYRQFTDGRIALVVRGRDDVRALVPAVLGAIRGVDPEQPVYDVRTMDEVRARSAAPRWLSTVIIGAFAVSALLLAGIGLYGVVAYGVTQRGREFGVRLALGAVPSDVLRLVIGNGTKIAVYGTALGLAGALVLVRAMGSLLYAIPPLDPLTFGSATAMLFAVAATASYLPARRAARTDPARALRAD
jgi:putative ABC transport system permease protein